MPLAHAKFSAKRRAMFSLVPTLSMMIPLDLLEQMSLNPATAIGGPEVK